MGFKNFRYILYCILISYSCSNENIEIAEPETPIINKNPESFTKTFGGSKNDVLQAVIKTTDKGYITLGYTQSNDKDVATKDNESFDYWLLKYDKNNDLQWQKTYGGSKDDRGADIIQTNDNGFLVTGHSRSNDLDVSKNAGNQDFWVLKLNEKGSILWQKTFGFSGADFGTTCIETNDNGYLITGSLDVTASNGLGNAKTARRHAGGDVWAIKINNNGATEWSKFYGGSFTDTPLGVVKTEDNGYILACSSDSNDIDITNNKGSYDFWILKIAADGRLLWQKSFGGSEIDQARAITTSNDSNFIIVGDTRSTDKDIKINNGGADIWIIKINTNGNLIWEKTIGAASFDVARSISNTQDNGFLISGSSRSADNGFVNQGQNDALLIKIDADGILQWQKTIGGSEIDFLYDAIELENKSIIAVGESSSNNGDIKENKGFSDALIINIQTDEK
ncbi:hypothetical protein DUT90_09300 [Polaribacter sp. WD7]|uniref:hypothetical protein n=1 Tax=Polaribacter sp. WD7 TaxID=2269061 RepID=UPI000DF1426C|nr:hypothetical protein [Polaribacter sp. WD7]RCS25967.1 hypothetical protein DUT90_09300 [Polaribacter sp. WD7]